MLKSCQVMSQSDTNFSAKSNLIKLIVIITIVYTYVICCVILILQTKAVKMKRIRKNQRLKQNEIVFTDVYRDGSLEAQECKVIVDSGDLVSFYYINSLYPEAGAQIKCLPKKCFYRIGG